MDEFDHHSNALNQALEQKRHAVISLIDHYQELQQAQQYVNELEAKTSQLITQAQHHGWTTKELKQLGIPTGKRKPKRRTQRTTQTP